MDIALVSYINTRPFVDGLEKEFSSAEAKLHLVPPAECAEYLLEEKCELALIPVGALPDFEDIQLLPNYCIGANGPVESVFILSHQPIETLETILLDRHSRSSNALTRVLMQHYWKLNPQYAQLPHANFDYIQGTTGGVVIGDKAIKIRDQFAYAYDLSEAWKYLTGLPFVFAVWAYRKDSLDAFQLERLNRAFRQGVAQATGSAERWAESFGLSKEFSIRYLNQYIDFRFDTGKHKALSLFTNALNRLPEIDPVFS